MRGSTAYLALTLNIGSPRFLYEIVEGLFRILVEAIKFEQHSGFGRVGVGIFEDVEDVKVRLKRETEHTRGLKCCPRSRREVCCEKHSPRWGISHSRHTSECWTWSLPSRSRQSRMRTPKTSFSLIRPVKSRAVCDGRHCRTVSN